MFELKVVSFFSGAHSLREYEGKCEALHGHNWKVEVLARGDTLNTCGLLLDFGELKTMLGKVLSQLDHAHLNQVEFFKTHNPSSENIAFFIYEQLRHLVAKKNAVLSRVTVWEQRDCCASYYVE